MAGHYKRGVAIAVQVIFGNSGGAIASNIYRGQDAPRYVLGRKWPCSYYVCRKISLTAHVALQIQWR